MISPGCTNCYAMRLAARLEAMGNVKYRGTTRRNGKGPVWTGQLNLDERTLQIPLNWSRSQRIFVNSMSDLFHEHVPVAFIHRVWDIMSRAHWHTFQILTKRPNRMRKLLTYNDFKILPNVWLGTSVECGDYRWRLDELRRTPAQIRFVSFEPLIGPIGVVDLAKIHWAIVGGESGPRSRPMEHNWVDEIHNACQEQHVAFFFKQWGGRRKKKTGRLLYGRTWDEYPQDSVGCYSKDRAFALL